MKLSVVIPARNEALNVEPTLLGLTSRLAAEGLDYEIVVVDDGSSDATARVVAGVSDRLPAVRLVRNTGLHGFGRAVRTGIAAAVGDAVVICMADDSDDPQDVVQYYYILRDEAECAFGSRFVPGARVAGYPRLKLLVNRVANLFITALFRLPYNDVTNAFKGYRRYVLDGCRPLLSPHFNLTVEIPLKAVVRGYTFKVVPIAWRNRRTGVSSLHIEEMGSRYLFIVLNVWLERLLTGGDYKRSDPRPVDHERAHGQHVTRSAGSASTGA